MSEYLTTAEFAERLGYHRKTIELWCRVGRIRAARPGMTPRSGYRIPYSELRRRTQLVAPPPIEKPSTEQTQADWEAVSQKLNLKGGRR